MTKRSWLILLLLLLTGCASNNQTTTPSTNTPETISLDFAVNPTKPTPNQAVTLTAKVMAGQKPVNDATVELEVWQDGSEQHSKLQTKRTADGSYSVTTTYPITGNYHVIIHATTPQVHQMIEKTFVVGEPPTEHHQHQNNDGVLLHIQLPTNAKSGEYSKLYGHITQQNKVLTGAKVQFEIWKTGATKLDFIDTTETKPGEYFSNYRFPTPGNYYIKLHVEKGSIHEHTEQTLEVK